MSSLNAEKTEVLVLRTGFGLEHSFTRQQVAKILRVSLRQEGRIEQQAVTGLGQAEASDHCSNQFSSMRSVVLRVAGALSTLTRGPLLTSGASPAVASFESSTTRAAARSRSRGRGRTAGRAASRPSPARRYKRAGIAQQSGGLNWLVLAALLAAGAIAIWLLDDRRRAQAETAGVPPRPLRGALPSRPSLRRGAEAVAGGIGLVALRRAIAERRSRPRGVDADGEPADLPGPIPTADPSATPEDHVPDGPEHAKAAAVGRPAAVGEETDAAPPSVPGAGRAAARRPRLRSLRDSGEAVADAIGSAAVGGSIAARRALRRARAGTAYPPPTAESRQVEPVPAEPAAAASAAPAAAEPARPAAAHTHDIETPRTHTNEAARIRGGADAVAAFELGGALVQENDLAGAEAAYRRADEAGHAAAATNLGVLLEKRGNLGESEAAYRRADERGDATGAFNLAAMLEERRDLRGAEAAYGRADKRGDATAAFKLAGLLVERNDLAGAEAAFGRAAAGGHAQGAFNLGAMLIQRDDFAGAEAAFRRADECGHASGAANLGVLLERQGDSAGAEAAYRRADQRGETIAAFNLGAMLLDRNDLAGAEDAFRRAAERGDAAAAETLQALIEQRDASPGRDR